MFVLYEFDNMKMTSNIARGDISRAGIIFFQGLQLRALLECGFYSREGLIWGNTVADARFHEILNQTVAENYFFIQQMPYCLSTLLVYMALSKHLLILDFLRLC